MSEISEIEGYVRSGIKNCLRELVEKETERAVENLRKKMKEQVGKIAVRLSTQFNVQTHGRVITITFMDEDVRREKK